MLFVLFYYLLVIFFLSIFLICIIKFKKNKRKQYFIQARIILWKLKLKYTSFVDKKYLQNIERKIKRITNELETKKERIDKLEDLVFGSEGNRFAGIQLPPLDLVNSGIFTIKK